MPLLIWYSPAIPLLQKAVLQLPIICKCLLSESAVHYARPNNHYETLGVKVTASPKEIKAAFVSRSKKVHPDMNRHDPKLHDKFVILNEAYSTLMKPVLRQKYDQSIGVAFYREPIYSQTNPRPYNPYHHGPPPQSMGSDQFYQDMLRNARSQYDSKQDEGSHSTPVHTFRPFILTLAGFTLIYIFFVSSNEGDRHQRMMTAHELTWRRMEEQNKEMVAQRLKVQQANGEAPQATNTHIKPAEKRPETLRERKRTLKKEKVLDSAKNYSDGPNKPESDKNS